MNLAQGKALIMKKPESKNPLVRFGKEMRKNWVLYLMVLPAICFVALFSYIPLVGIYYAFTNYNFIGGLFKSPFVGLANFRYLFNGGLNAPVWLLTKNTVLYNLVFIFLGNALQCVMAILLTEIRGRKFHCALVRRFRKKKKEETL